MKETVFTVVVLALLTIALQTLTPCEKECERLHKQCLKEPGHTLLDCINVYYDCVDKECKGQR